MGRKLALASLILGLIPVLVQWGNAQEQNAKQPQRIAIPDLKKKLDSGEKLLLIDVREDWEIKQNGAIPGAIHIPMGELDERMKDIPKDVEIIFY